MEAAVIILAAGSSRRMKQPKLLLPWGHTSIIGHQIWTWTALGARQIAVVCAAGDDAMRTELDRLNFSEEDRIINERPGDEMFGSIRCAANWPGWEKGLTHWVITLGDQPHVRTATLRGILACAAAHPGKICQPLVNGHLRHPVVLPRDKFDNLRQTGAATLKEFLNSRASDVFGCELNDPGLNEDIDTPEDYEQLKSSSRPEPSASSAGGL